MRRPLLFFSIRNDMTLATVINSNAPAVSIKTSSNIPVRPGVWY